MKHSLKLTRAQIPFNFWYENVDVVPILCKAKNFTEMYTEHDENYSSEEKVSSFKSELVSGFVLLEEHYENLLLP